jgi:hypothetical protein
MVTRNVPLLLLATLLLTTASQAGGVEPGSSLRVQPPRPRPPQAAEPSSSGISLSRFLEEPGKEEGRLELWLRFNREARLIEEGTLDFLATLNQVAAKVPMDIIYAHERVQLEAELLAAEQEIEALKDARAELLEERGKGDPERAILEGEQAPPWSPDGTLDGEALVGLAFAHTGRSGPLSPLVKRAMGRLGSVERRLDVVEHQLLPAAEEALGATLLALSAGEASLLEILHGLHFLKHQHRNQLELRVHRELLLLEVARQVGCRVEQLPWVKVPTSG